MQMSFFNSQNEHSKILEYEHLNTYSNDQPCMIRLLQAMQKKEVESRIAEEPRLKSAIGRFPFVMMKDDNDIPIAITPIYQPKPVHSLMNESKGVPKVCDVPFHENSPPLDISKDQSEDLSDSNVDSTSTDEDSFSSNDVEYVEASPPNSEPV
ncbi:hypothetical protein Tco_1391354 [Tanacetum coccineum]